VKEPKKHAGLKARWKHSDGSESGASIAISFVIIYRIFDKQVFKTSCFPSG
jgi:hypothetical protein